MKNQVRSEVVFGFGLGPLAISVLALLLVACPRQGGNQTSFEVNTSEPTAKTATQEIKRETEQTAEAARKEKEGAADGSAQAGGEELARFRKAALNATYWLSDNLQIELKDGKWSKRYEEDDLAWEEEARLLGEPVAGDLDGDGDPDLAFILVYSGGGSGVFVYLAGAINDGGEARPLDTVLLGDRVKVERLSIAEDGTLTVRYLTRKPDQPMAAEPTVPVELRFRVEEWEFRQIV